MNHIRLFIFSIMTAIACMFLMTACGAKTSGPTDVQCTNPIYLKDTSMQRVRHVSEMPPGQFQLSSLQVYLVDQSSKDSFAASASSMDNFSSISIDCYGFHSSGQSFTADFSAGSSVDFLNALYGVYSYDLNFHFNNGRLAMSRTGTTRDNAFVFGQTLSDNILHGRTAVNPAATMRVALYAPTATLVEVRVERAGLADQNGNRMLEFLRAVYEKK